MSDSSGVGGGGFRPASTPQVTTQIQARQAQLQQIKQQAVANYGSPASADSFTRSQVAEKGASAAGLDLGGPIPKSPQYQAAYGSSKKKDSSNPFAASGSSLKGLFNGEQNVDLGARYQFGADSDSLASLS